MKLRAARWGGAFLVVALLGFASGLYVDQAFPGSPLLPYLAHHSVGRIDTTELEQAIQVIQANYVDRNLDATKLSHGTVQGLIAALGDPFSAYYDPAAYKKLQDTLQGQYSGVGIYLTFGTGYPMITGTLPDSPASKAGLQAGDQITKVGDQDMKGATAAQATAAIQGPNGTMVTLTILRGTSTFTVTVTRAEITVPSVRSAIIGNQVLYIRIYQFGGNTSTEFATALKNGLKGAKGVVLDLRDDPGGYISAADDVISEFVASGETFELRDRDGNVERHDASGSHDAASVPLVVLVNANSASASEITAGSLQVHKRAKLIGTTTYGKGSVQLDFPLNDGSDLHLTIKRWYLPNGVTIDHKGLTPDITVTLASPNDEYDVTKPADGFAKDAQLLAALKALAG
ncbi:MAG: carboxyl-terminal processing protease [Chloroflexota bacterium]|nr:carboxyl-terminal processing protease [Chloroflexota bacterium]